MQCVHIASDNSPQAIIDLTPGRSGDVDGLHFVTMPDCENADWLVAFADLRGLMTTVPIERRIAIMTEPPGIKVYWPGYLNQFGILLSPFEVPGFVGKHVFSHPCISWGYGMDVSQPTLTYEDLLSSRPAPKVACVSAVFSGKLELPLHRRRLRLARRLKARLGDRFELFGRGFQKIPDKRAAIDPFRYHLAVENTIQDHYWTEKLADPLLGWSLPIYCGDPAAGQYFPGDAYLPLDLNDLDAAVERVAAIVESDPYEQHVSAIGEARHRLITRYSLPATIARVIHEIGPARTAPLASPVLLRHNKAFQPVHAAVRRVFRRWYSSAMKPLRRRDWVFDA